MVSQAYARLRCELHHTLAGPVKDEYGKSARRRKSVTEPRGGCAAGLPAKRGLGLRDVDQTPSGDPGLLSSSFLAKLAEVWLWRHLVTAPLAQSTQQTRVLCKVPQQPENHIRFAFISAARPRLHGQTLSIGWRTVGQAGRRAAGGGAEGATGRAPTFTALTRVYFGPWETAPNGFARTAARCTGCTDGCC